MSEAPNLENQGDTTSAGVSREEILKVIYKELEKVNHQKISLTEQTDIATDMNVDSVAIMDLVFELEETFDVSVSLNDLADTRTIGQLADLVVKTSDNT